ncbi:uncharacterized protein CLUP02_07059, partial [Colletotrichum lupini]
SKAASKDQASHDCDAPHRIFGRVHVNFKGPGPLWRRRGYTQYCETVHKRPRMPRDPGDGNARDPDRRRGCYPLCLGLWLADCAVGMSKDFALSHTRAPGKLAVCQLCSSRKPLKSSFGLFADSELNMLPTSEACPCRPAGRWELVNLEGLGLPASSRGRG